MKYIFLFCALLSQSSAWGLETSKTFYLQMYPEDAAKLFEQGKLRGEKTITTKGTVTGAAEVHAKYQVADVEINGSLVRCWKIVDDGQAFIAAMIPSGKVMCFIPRKEDFKDFPAPVKASKDCSASFSPEFAEDSAL